MDRPINNPLRRTQLLLGCELVNHVQMTLDGQVVELYMTLLEQDHALLARVSRYSPDALEDHFHRELLPMARRHPKLKAVQEELALLGNRPVGADWRQVAAMLSVLVGESLLPKFEATFQFIRERVHAGAPITLKLCEPWQRALWYRMLVPISLQESYTLDDWNREVVPNAEFPVWNLASEGDSSACGIFMLVGHRAGGPPYPIDEFFSIEHLCGRVAGIQDSLETAWNLFDSLGGAVA